MNEDFAKLQWLAQNFPHSHKDDPSDSESVKCVRCIAIAAIDEISEAATETMRQISRIIVSSEEK